jgi:uncharacterized membrane protein (UPF0127 family)
MNMKNIIPLILLVALGIVYFLYAPAGEKTVDVVSFAGQELVVEIADNQFTRNRGLSDREILEEGSGMLFVFDKEGEYRFWMKDMLFPIDILWFNSEKELVDVTLDISPDTFPDHFTSKVPARYVLEVNVGEFSEPEKFLGQTLELSTRKSDD